MRDPGLEDYTDTDEIEDDENDEIEAPDGEATFDDDHPSPPDDEEDGTDGETSAEASAHPETTDARRWVPHASLVLEYLPESASGWRNPRRFTGLDDESLQELAQSIRQHTVSDDTGVYAGIRSPLEIVQILVNGNVLHLIIDGQRRYKGAEIADLTGDVLIPVIDLEREPVAWTMELAHKYLMRAHETESTRRGLSSFELSETAGRLRGNKNPDTGKEFTLAQIGRAIGRSEGWVSRILEARNHASARLLHQWEKGEITDEVFKDLAKEKDKAAQESKAGEVAAARGAGDKAKARTLAKETKEIAKAQAPAKPAKAPKPAKVAKGKSKAKNSKAEAEAKVESKAKEQVASEDAPKRPPSPAIIDDMLTTAKRHPPTHDYVRGLMDGVRWSRGFLDAAYFAKPFGKYLQHVQSKSKR